MIRKVSYLALGIAIGAGCAGWAPQTLSAFSQSAYAAAADTYRQLNLFGDVFDKIRDDYVEKPDESKLIEAAINGMLSSLDPHSSYMDAKAYRDMQVQTKGEFGGLGHRSHGRGRLDQGRQPDRRHARRQGRHSLGRHHRRDRRRVRRRA